MGALVLAPNQHHKHHHRQQNSQASGAHYTHRAQAWAVGSTNHRIGGPSPTQRAYPKAGVRCTRSTPTPHSPIQYGGPSHTQRSNPWD